MDRYSRIVFLLKVLLPIAALGLLSALFLFSRNTTPMATLPFAEHEVSERVRGQQVTDAYYTGTTQKGEEVAMLASVVHPGQNGAAARAEDLSITMSLLNGGKVVLNSIDGLINLPGSIAVFEKDVVIATETGIRLQSDLLYSALDRVEIRSPGPVRGIAVLGHLDAGQMELNSFSDDTDLHILFSNGVKLVYNPEKPER